MFRRLKEKISEEVKQSPLAQYSPFKDDSSKNMNQDFEATTSKQDSKNLIDLHESNASIREETDENQSFSIGDDDGETTSPTPTVPLFENVDLSDSLSPQTFVSHPRRRTSSVSSSSGLFPAYSPSSLSHNIQSELESASEVEDSVVNLDVVSKEQLFSAFQKAKLRYAKYKTRYGDVVRAYRDQVAENGKVKIILTESQDKALRRISELKEQSQLDQKAKIDLEENFRLILEEKDEVVRVLQTQVRLLKSGVNPVDDNDATSDSSSVFVDFDNKSNEEEAVVQPDPDKKLRLQEDTINKLKNLLKSCKETIAKEKKTSARLTVEKDELVSKLDETESKLKTVLEDQLLKEQSFDEELKRAAEKIDCFKQGEEDHTLNLAESKRLMHEEMEVRERSLQELKLQLQQSNSQIASLESSLQEKSKMLLELEEAKHDNLDKSKQRLIEAEEALEEEKQNVLQEMSRGKAAALQLLQQETEKKICELEKVKSDSDVAWKEKFDAVKHEYEESIAANRSVSEQNLVQMKESRDRCSDENEKLKERLVHNDEQTRFTLNRIAELKAMNNELCLDLAILNENQLAACKETRIELLAQIENVWSSETKNSALELERMSSELSGREERTNELELCVASLKELQANSEREAEALQRKHASLCENNSEFQRVIEELSEMKQSLEERLESASSLAVTLQIDRDKSESDAKEMKTQLEKLEEENAALKRHADEELAKLLEENKCMEKECEVLRAEKADSDAEIVRLSIEIEKEEDLQQSLVTLRAELESKDDDNAAKLRRIEGEAAQRLDEVSAENERACLELRQSLELERSKVSDLNTMLAVTKQDNDAQLLEVNQRLALELDNMRNATESLKCEVDATREQLSSSKSEYTERINHLKEQIRMKDTQVQELIGSGDPELMLQLERVRRDYDELYGRKFESRKLLNELLADLRERLSEVKEQLNDGRNTLETKRSEYDAMHESLKQILISVVERNEASERNHTEQIAVLTSNITDLKSSHDDAVSDCEKQIRSLGEQVNDLKHVRDDLSKSLGEAAEEATELRQRLESRENSFEEKSKNYENEVLNKTTEIGRVVENLELSDRLAAEIKEELGKCRKLLTEKEEEVVNSAEIANELKQEVNTLRSANERLEQEASDLKNASESCDDLKRELEVCKDDAKQRQHVINDLATDLASENHRLESELLASKNALEENSMVIAELQKSFEDGAKERQNHEAEMDTLKKLHKDKLNDLNQKFKTKLKNVVGKSSEKVSAAEEKLTMLGKERMELEKQLDKVKETNVNLEVQVEELRNENLTARSEFETLLSDCKASHLAELNEQLEAVARLETESRKLKEELEVFTVHNEQMNQSCIRENRRKEELEGLVADLECQVEELRSALILKDKEAADRSIAEHEKHQKHLGEAMERVNEENEKLLSSIKIERNQLTKELETLTAFSEDLKQDYGRERSKREELDASVRELKESLATSREKENVVASLESRIEELQSALCSKNKEAEESLVELQEEHKRHLDATVARINEENHDKLNNLKTRAENKLAQIKKQMHSESERLTFEFQSKIDSLNRLQAESEAIQHQSVEKEEFLEAQFRELQEKHKTETESLKLQCLAFEQEKESLFTQLQEKNSQIDESLITAQINHMDSTKKLRVLQSELEESRNRNDETKAVVDDLRLRLSVSETERSVLASQLEEFRNAGAKDDEEEVVREALRKEYEELRNAMADEHAAKIKQLTREFSEMIATKEKEGQEALANAIEQSLNDDNRIRRDHARQIESIGHQISEKERDLEAELERREKRINTLESELESTVRNCEEKLGLSQAEQRLQTDTMDKKWKAAMRRELQEREEAYREEIEGLAEEWQMERKFAVNSNSVELNGQELQKQAKLATTVVESGGYSNELLRRQVMTMQSQLQMLKDRHRDEVKQLKDALRSLNCAIPDFDESRYSSIVLEQRLESLETEYLKNILFEYMMGRETLTLAKVIAAVVRFSDEQTSKVLEREEARSGGVGGQLVQFLK